MSTYLCLFLVTLHFVLTELVKHFPPEVVPVKRIDYPHRGSSNLTPSLYGDTVPTLPALPLRSRHSTTHRLSKQRTRKTRHDTTGDPTSTTTESFQPCHVVNLRHLRHICQLLV